MLRIIVRLTALSISTDQLATVHYQLGPPENLTDLYSHALSAHTHQKNANKVEGYYIAGLTINFTQEDWRNEINLAASHGIDAFCLNVGTAAKWQVDQVSTAYEIATQIKTSWGNPFKMFLSLDMSVIESASEVSQWVTTFVPAPAQLLIDGRPLISTFSGENNHLGGGSLSAGWQAAVKEPLMSLVPPINPLFVPAWMSLNPKSAVSDNPVMDGIMNWLSWPIGTEKMSTKADLLSQKDAKESGKLYMAGVSPCFFTHYPEKNWIYRSELISMPHPPDFVQIISWNDYGESHYIGSLNAGTQPDGTTWVDGFDHQAWLSMSEYFIKWYKSGSPPPITHEQIYFHYRPHSSKAVASSDPLGPPQNATSTTDAIYLSTFIPSDSTARQLGVSVGSNTPQIINKLPLGDVGTFAVPWTGEGGAVKVDLMDSTGKKLLTGTGGININNKIDRYNFSEFIFIITFF
ncbi:hypothetical protein CROQUDRAFT_672281 [Cronartium quercuum f. sp. fusiforme G11]|uniref:Glycoside hydrolase family 71 protein n=1 Tax=Cronartium quercuum f. sp. fusiforme G11 TaxID=708437 RepID=A0A9P6NJ96_9BASI|nr:hypothetical protein CROQUDRAFT_672281 [Cronartium quercuum f. sp. fusiforme G11]